ncbi:MAG: GIY-YIG nuclease family protein [Agathobacter sp.]|nr:GIY-YIG nuclease family protein [Agathobacter sp.]
MIGIYKITNITNGKAYIGQSINIEKRWRSEQNAAFEPNSAAYEYPLQRAFRKYGLNNFTFEIIEECQQSELNNKEMYWIQHHNTFFNGYNQTLGGDGQGSGMKTKVIGIINDLKNTDLFQYEIATKWNISTEMVQGINTGRYWHHNATYPLRQHKCNRTHKSNKTQNVCPQCGTPIRKKASLCITCYREKLAARKPSKETLINKVQEFGLNLKKLSKELGAAPSTIKAWLESYDIDINKNQLVDKKGSVLQEQDIVQRFLKNKSIISTSQELGLSRDVIKDILCKNNINTYWYIVGMYSAETPNTCIKVFDNAQAAIEYLKAIGFTKARKNYIASACRGERKTAYGYSWKYINEIDNGS